MHSLRFLPKTVVERLLIRLVSMATDQATNVYMHDRAATDC